MSHVTGKEHILQEYLYGMSQIVLCNYDPASKTLRFLEASANLTTKHVVMREYIMKDIVYTNYKGWERGDTWRGPESTIYCDSSIVKNNSLIVKA
ncbi:hypothetical protein J6590_007619 [Homalodisca vitripennis]|nr:hypothetical protein J6590_007619 [Homalodisca vitripennis]